MRRGNDWLRLTGWHLCRATSGVTLLRYREVRLLASTSRSYPLITTSEGFSLHEKIYLQSSGILVTWTHRYISGNAFGGVPPANHPPWGAVSIILFCSSVGHLIRLATEPVGGTLGNTNVLTIIG